MTLLLVEKQRVDEDFDARWLDWQQRRAPAPLISRQEAGPLYDHVAFLLYEYYPQVALHSARQVMLASRATGMHTFLQQRINDGTLAPEDGLAACAWLRNLAHEQLSECIPGHASFWQQYATWYLTCQYAFEEERGCLSPAARNYPPARFWTLVEGKTSAAAMTSAAFAYLADDRDVLTPLQEAQRHLYAGLHIYRDVLNWKNDFITGRSSYLLITLLMEFPDLVVADGQAGRQEQAQDIGRRLYYSGLAERFLTTTSDHLCRSMAAVTTLPPTGWGAFVAGLLEQNEPLRKDISQIRSRNLSAAHSRRSRSDERNVQFGSAVAPAQPVTPAAIERSMSAAARYLAQEQATDGSWGDFMLLAEQSTFWVTGYVGWTLQQTLPGGADLALGAQWLLARQYPGGGWGYNSHWPVDTDSIANVLLFLSGQPGIVASRWMPAMEVLLAGQKPNGGFTTILDPEAWMDRFRSSETNLAGWTSAHPCVTAVVTLLLATLGEQRYRLALERAIAYLWSCQSSEGFWDAYWWQGRLYTTSRVVQTLHTLGVSAEEPRLAGIRAWLVASQGADGGWSGSAERDASQAFHTALAVLALCFLSNREQETAALVRGIEWLLAHQNSDGSWPAVPILRVPRPDVLRPWEQTSWRESLLGLDVVVPDWRRLFTTATAIQALHQFTAKHSAL